MLLHRALTVGEQIVAALRAHPAAERVELAGSARRQADSVKDLDIIATASDPGALVRALGELDLIESASAPNQNAARGRTHTGLPVDLRVVEPENFGNLLQHFTGSAAHNVALREAAVRRGLHVSEYGILDDATGETLRCATEEEVYERLGLAFPPPELRENRGELAPGFVAPRLVEVSDLRGDLHMHTVASDGRNTIEEMARAAQARGYEYLAITDHSATHGFGDHVTPDELERQIERDRGGQRAPGRHRGPRRDRDEHPARRVAGLRRRAARAAGLGRRVGAHVVRDAGGGDDQAHGRGDRASVDRRDRPSDGAQDHVAPAVRARHRRGHRGRGADAARCSRSTRRRTAATSTTCTRARRWRPAC